MFEREFYARLGKRIRAARHQHQPLISQAKLGAPLGLTFQQVQKYERGDNRCPLDKLMVICTTCGVSIEWMLNGVVEELTATTAPDIGATLLSLPYGADLARDYVAIQHNVDRRVVADVARAIAHRGQADA